MVKKHLLKPWTLVRMIRGRRNKRKIVAGTAALSLLVAIAMLVQPAPKSIDPTAYGTLLAVIAEGESKGNYNAHFSNANNTTVRFTDMSISEVLQWQQEYVRQGSVSSAVGRYQIVQPTMLELVQELTLDRDTRFDEGLQDRMAIFLLERRGSIAYINNELSREQFAANLAKEWAALPKMVGDNPEESYYADDGINASRISVQAVYSALDMLKAEPTI